MKIPAGMTVVELTHVTQGDQKVPVQYITKPFPQER